MSARKTGKEMFMVIGVNHNELCVWTESFDIQGVFDNQEDAQAHCDELNETDDEEGQDQEYEVYPLDVLKPA